MALLNRPTLGSYMSLVCFQYLRVGTEDVAERAPIVAAGRQRGTDCIEEEGLLGSTTDAKVIHEKLDALLGENGTRLCLVKQVLPKASGGYEVYISECACTAGQTSEKPHCAFTLGVFIGAISAITGTRMKGVETECEACGNPQCVYQIDPI